MVAAFPLAKLGTLLLRQASKPIAVYAKEQAKKSQFFRTYICMPPAQIYNWCEVKMKMWIMNLGRPVDIPKLNEAMAIELGANLLGEAIIFTVAAALLYMEYTRQTRKEAAKEDARKSELDTLGYTIQELYFQTEKQDAQIRELTRTIIDLESKVLKKPFSGPSPPLIILPEPEDSREDRGVPEGGHGSDGLVTHALRYVTNDVFPSRGVYSR
ncbi:hypothetical protein AAG570_014098 [Ranatra chinensis]|uniref:OPA3-like protein CG13603 n=1 Tax=Ranatra chinensis TaxID=642074 RepID=A0ABD0XRY1_9HEMI